MAILPSYLDFTNLSSNKGDKMVDWYQDSLVIPRQLATLRPKMTVHLDELDLENPDDIGRLWHVRYI